MCHNNYNAFFFLIDSLDLENTREDVVKEVINAPKRRLDNEISRVADATALLHLHISVLNEVLDLHSKEIFKSNVIVAMCASLSMALLGSTWAALFLGTEVTWLSL